MQVIYQNEKKKEISGGVGILDLDICIERIGKCVERKNIGRFGIRGLGIPISRKTASSIKERFWKRRQ